MKLIDFCILILFSTASFQVPLHANCIPRELNFPQKVAAPYLIPEDHPIKAALDYLFSQTRATENQTTLLEAGFEIVAVTQISLVIVARHPAFPGYIFKMYLDSETRVVREAPNWTHLFTRCKGAQRIKKVIREKKLHYFTVPDKWLYLLPKYPLSREQNPQPLILVETDMEIDDEETTRKKWLNVKSKHLDELYEILKLGYASTSLVKNVPSTKNGKFAFIDTEYTKRNLPLEKVKNFLSAEMRKYWDSLIEE